SHLSGENSNQGLKELNTPQTTNNIKDFKNQLINQLENKGFNGIPNVLKQIANSGFEYDNTQLATHQSNAQSQLTALNPRPFIAQIKIFIETLSE
ncbi:MAG: hypothetical protein U9Q83_06905, partial [Bacteroidota bacterium]|nr:hypothetical protein [Bacteroidota bacterium]